MVVLWHLRLFSHHGLINIDPTQKETHTLNSIATFEKQRISKTIKAIPFLNTLRYKKTKQNNYYYEHLKSILNLTDFQQVSYLTAFKQESGNQNPNWHVESEKESKEFPL